MHPAMSETGQRLERQVAEMMDLIAAIQRDLAHITGFPETEAACTALAERRAALEVTVDMLRQGASEVDRRLESYMAALARREADLEAARAEAHSLTYRLVQVQENERRSLARDLHDTCSGAMTAIGLGLTVLKRDSCCSAAMIDRIEELQRAAVTVSEELHRLSANLRPATLDRYGLVPAAEELITALANQTPTQVDFRVEGPEERLPGDVETALYRIIQEACTNIARYAQARRATVLIRCRAGSVRVQVEDDGVGFDLAEALARGRLGLVGMRERAEMLGGTLTIDTQPGAGVRLVVDAPVAEGAPEPEPAVALSAVAPVDATASSDAARLAHARVLSAALAEITAGISQLDDAAAVLAFVLERAAEAVGCDYAVIGERRGSRWLVTHAYGLPVSMLGQRLLSAALPLAEEIERTRGVVVVNDTHADNPLAAAAAASGVYSGAGIPLITAGKFLGAVAFVHNSAPVTFKPGEVAFLQHLSSMISLVLEIIALRGGAAA